MTPTATTMTDNERPALPPLTRVAVLRALPGLGDFLCAVPALRALRVTYPATHLTLIGLPQTAALAARFRRYVDAFVPFPGYPGLAEQPMPDPRAMVSFLATARAQGWDLAVQMHGSGGVTNPITGLLGAKMTVGYYVPGQPCPNIAHYLPYPDDLHEIHRNLRLAAFLGATTTDTALTFPITWDDHRAFFALPGTNTLAPGSFVVVHPGASTGARRWPPKRFAHVADGLAARGMRVVLTGTTAEATVTGAVIAAMKYPVLDLTGQTDLGTLAVLLARARLVLCNDTGVSHLAAALHVPSVVIFTASAPDRWAPLDRARHRVLIGGVAVPVELALAEARALLAWEGAARDA